MQLRFKTISIITACLLLSLNFANAKTLSKEFISAEQLTQALDKNLIWCYGQGSQCSWIDAFDMSKNINNQWYREPDQSHDSVTVRIASIILKQNYLCDEKAQANVNYSTHYYINANHRWLNIDKIPELLDHSAEHLAGTIGYHNSNLSCYAYKDLGIDDDGFQRYEQVIFSGGINGKRAAETDIFRVIPIEKAKVMFLME